MGLLTMKRVKTRLGRSLAERLGLSGLPERYGGYAAQAEPRVLRLLTESQRLPARPTAEPRVSTRKRRKTARNARMKKDSELHEFEPCPDTTIGTVVESAELRTINVVLHVSRVPMIRDVEDRHTHSTLVLLSAKGNSQTLSD